MSRQRGRAGRRWSMVGGMPGMGGATDMMSVVKKAAAEAGIDLGKMRRRSSVQIHASMEAIANAEFNAIAAPLREQDERQRAAKTIQQHFREFMDARRPHIETREYAPAGDLFPGRAAPQGELPEPSSGQVGRQLPAGGKGRGKKPRGPQLEAPEAISKGAERVRARRASWSGPINLEDGDREAWDKAKRKMEALPRPEDLPLPTFRASVGTPPAPSAIRLDDDGLLEVSEEGELRPASSSASEAPTASEEGPSTPPEPENSEAPRMPLLQVRSMTKVPPATVEKALEEAIEGAIEAIEATADLNRPFVIYKSVDVMPSYLDKYRENLEANIPEGKSRESTPGDGGFHLEFDFGNLGVLGEQMGLTDIRLGSRQGRDPQTIQDLIRAHLYFRMSDQSPVVVHICESDPCSGFCGMEGCQGSLPKVGFCGSFMCWGEENCGVPGCPGGRGSLKVREEMDIKAEAYVAAVRARRAITPMRLVEPLQKGQVLQNASPGTLRGCRLKKYPPSPLLQKRSQQLDEPFEDRYDQVGGMCKGKRSVQFSGGGFYGQRSQKHLGSPFKGKPPPGGEPSSLDRRMMSTVRSTTKTRLTFP